MFVSRGAFALDASFAAIPIGSDKQEVALEGVSGDQRWRPSVFGLPITSGHVDSWWWTTSNDAVGLDGASLANFDAKRFGPRLRHAAHQR
jgi:hypothetical protein